MQDLLRIALQLTNYRFVKSMNMFAKAARGFMQAGLLNIGSLFILKAENKDENSNLVLKWQSHAGRAVLMTTKLYGGLGLTLIDGNHVILSAPDWNGELLRVESFIKSFIGTTDEQAEDRCHRIGQQRPVTSYWCVTEYVSIFVCCIDT